MPGLATTIVTTQKIRRKMAMAKKRPMRPRTPMLRYHTPTRRVTGQRGNMTPASTTATMPTAAIIWRIGFASTNQA